jgi:hypothetical protein
MVENSNGPLTPQGSNGCRALPRGPCPSDCPRGTTRSEWDLYTWRARMQSGPAVLAPGPRLRRERSPDLRARPGDWPRPSAAPVPQLRRWRGPSRPGPAHAPETCGWCWPRARQYPTCGLTDTARGPGLRAGWPLLTWADPVRRPAQLPRPAARSTNLTRAAVRPCPGTGLH